MATRAAIGRTNDGRDFRGVRHNKNNTPENLGKTLWNLLHGKFKGNLEAMLMFLINEHEGGWSSIVGANFDLPANYKDAEGFGPKCFCHGFSSASANIITPENMEDNGVRWVYAFDEAKRTLEIFKSNASVAKVFLDKEEPDWGTIECGKNFEFCEHPVSYHLPEMIDKVSGRMSMMSYKGHKKADIYDICAVYVEGRRYEFVAFSKGGNSTLHAMCQAAGDIPRELCVAQLDKTLHNDYRPPGYTVWVFPPTEQNQSETTFDGKRYREKDEARI